MTAGRSVPARRTKAVVEWIVALTGLVALSPLLAAIAVGVRASSPGPIIHRRRVVGRGGVPFDAFKFRTMVADADERLARDPQLKAAFADRFKLKDDPRVTRLGRVLRRHSLDELPQLVNVLRGEMALIGPRMLSPGEVERYGVCRDRLFSVRPGLTGLWQVSGRQNTTYEERVRLDMRYIAEWSPWLDLTIALRTVRVIVKAEGAC